MVGQTAPPLKAAGNVLHAHRFRYPPAAGGGRRESPEAVRTSDRRSALWRRDFREFEPAGTGWDAPALAPWLAQATSEASQAFYGKDAAYLGLGGSIPFMCMLGERFPQAQFLITGVLGPKSNAHGPNEFLHIPYAKRLTACVAYILARYAELAG